MAGEGLSGERPREADGRGDHRLVLTGEGAVRLQEAEPCGAGGARGLRCQVSPSPGDGATLGEPWSLRGSPALSVSPGQVSVGSLDCMWKRKMEDG